MATRTITTSIALDGEKEFKRQIGEVNRELKNLKTEMAYTEEVFKDQADSTEALTAKGELLRREIDQQEEKIRALEQAVKDSAEAYGDSDKRTDDWRSSLTRARTDLVKMQRELNDTEEALKDTEKELKDNADAVDDFGDSAGDISLGNFTTQLGKLKQMVVGGAIATGIKEAAGAILDLEESTREYRTIMGNLEVSSQQAGYTAEETQEAYLKLYGVLGDPQTAATTLANLQAVQLSQRELLTVIDQTVGAWGRYGDSIPIDGLAEAINETIRAGQVTGTFADVLNWGSKEGETFGVTLKDNIEFTELSKKELDKLTESQREQYDATKEQYDAITEYNEGVQDATAAEDLFNIALADCETQAERVDLVLRTLSEMGLAEAGQSWRDLNADIVESNESQARMEAAMGRLGEAVAPAADAIRNVGAGAIEYFAGVVEGAIELVSNFLDWWDKFTEAGDEDAWERRTAQRSGEPAPQQEEQTESEGAKTSGLGTTAAREEKFGRPETPEPTMEDLIREEQKTTSLLQTSLAGQGLTSAIEQAQTRQTVEENINITVQSVLDGKVLGESVTKYQKDKERANGR